MPHFIGKGIKYCDFKYPVDSLAGAFVKMGFASPDPIDVGGRKVVPRDALLKLVSPPANTFFTENQNVAGQPLERAELLLVEVKGSKSGDEIRYAVDTPSNFYRTAEERSDVYRKFGTVTIGVALPAVVGAKMCIGGMTDRGVISAECLDADRFFKLIADAGAPVSLRPSRTLIPRTNGLDERGSRSTPSGLTCALYCSAMELKKVRTWPDGPHTALKPNNITHETFAVEDVVSDKIF